MAEEFSDKIKDLTKTLDDYMGDVKPDLESDIDERATFMLDNEYLSRLMRLVSSIENSKDLHNLGKWCAVFHKVYNGSVSKRAKEWFHRECGEEAMEKLNYLVDNFRTK